MENIFFNKKITNIKQYYSKKTLYLKYKYNKVSFLVNKKFKKFQIKYLFYNLFNNQINIKKINIINNLKKKNLQYKKIIISL